MTQTKKSIQQTFMKLYDKYDYNKITIKSLCENIPIARTTFYSYYTNIDEAKCDIEDQLIHGLLEVTHNISKGNIPNMDFMLFLDATQSYIEDNWDWIYIFLVKQENHRFINKWKNAISDNFRKRYPLKQNIKNYELISELIASTTISAYAYWLKYPNKVKKEDMKTIIKETLDAIVEII